MPEAFVAPNAPRAKEKAQQSRNRDEKYMNRF
jgi:hypothetical protein